MASDKYTVIVSEKAKNMLCSHMLFLSPVSIKAVKEKQTEIKSALKSLESMPQRFPFFNEDYIPANRYHKMLIRKWYVVLYQIKDNTVFVDYILDCRKDNEDLF